MSNFKIFGNKSGKCLIKVTKEGDDKYNSISNLVYVDVKKNQPTLFNSRKYK